VGGPREGGRGDWATWIKKEEKKRGKLFLCEKGETRPSEAPIKTKKGKPNPRRRGEEKKTTEKDREKGDGLP